MRRLTLLAPGLLGPELPAGTPPGAGEAMAGGLDLGATELALARAERISPVAACERELFASVGLGLAEGADLPVAAIALRGEGHDPGDAWWMRADPVHLRADLTDLVLGDVSCLGLDAGDAARLVAPLDEHFAEDGLRFEVHAPGRWYLRLARPAALSTCPPAEAVGRSVSALLPAGPDARVWHARLNEAQMLLHASPVNRERAARGQPPVNSLWLWGGGRLPPAPRRPGEAPGQDAPVDALVGAGVLGRGLARHVGARWEALPDHLDELDEVGHALVCLEAPGVAARLSDVEGWRDALGALEAGWVAPALAALRSGRIETFELCSRRTGRLRLTRASLRRFWRRPRSLAALIEAGAVRQQG